MKVFHTNREEIVLFTLEEVSKELGISYRTVRRYAAEERFPVCEIGRNKYVWMRHLASSSKVPNPPRDGNKWSLLNSILNSILPLLGTGIAAKRKESSTHGSAVF